MVSINFTAALLVAVVLACAKISLSCLNYRNILKELKKWVYWCYGAGRLFGGNQPCDCERALYFSEARLACERTDSGKRIARIGITKATNILLVESKSNGHLRNAQR